MPASVQLKATATEFVMPGLPSAERKATVKKLDPTAIEFVMPGMRVSAAREAVELGSQGVPTEVHVSELTSQKNTPRPRKLKFPLVWIDLEMTGLDVAKDTIIELAVVLTDGKLEQIISGPEIAIHHEEAVLENMNDWSREHHGASGLTQRCRESNVSLEQAEETVLSFLREHVQPVDAQLAGSSVHVDRMFLLKYMPKVASYLHYRIVDVSTLQELCKRWYPEVMGKSQRRPAAHTAMADILGSIEELKFYKATLFKRKSEIQAL